MTSLLSCLGKRSGALFHQLAVTTNCTNTLLSYSALFTRTHTLVATVLPKSELVARTRTLVNRHNNFQKGEAALSVFSGIQEFIYDRTKTSRLLAAANIVASTTSWPECGQLLKLVRADVNQTIGSLSVYGHQPLSRLGKLAELPLHKSLSAIGLSFVMVTCGFVALLKAKPDKPTFQDENNLTPVEKWEEAQYHHNLATRNLCAANTFYYGLLLTSMFRPFGRTANMGITTLGIIAAAMGIYKGWVKHKEHQAELSLPMVDQERSLAAPAPLGTTTAASTPFAIPTRNSLSHWTWHPVKNSLEKLLDVFSQNRNSPDSHDKFFKLHNSLAGVTATIYELVQDRQAPQALSACSQITKEISSVINPFIAFKLVDQLNPINDTSSSLVSQANYKPREWKWYTKVTISLSYALNKLTEGAIVCRDTRILEYAYNTFWIFLFGDASKSETPRWSWFEKVKDLSTTFAASIDLSVRGYELYTKTSKDRWQSKVAIVGNVQKIFLSQYYRYLDKPIRERILSRVVVLPRNQARVSNLFFKTVALLTAITLGYKSYCKNKSEAVQHEKKMASYA